LVAELDKRIAHACRFSNLRLARQHDAKCESPLFGELADCLSMFLIRSDRARAGNNQAGFIALRRNGSGKKNDSGSAR
jgi:hypothetical protein